MTGNPPAGVAAPCGDLQQAAAHHCAEADRLVTALTVAEEELRAARRQRGEVLREMESDVRLGDRRALKDAKAAALATYRAEYEHAHDGSAVMVAAATWLNGVSQLNRGARRAEREAAGLARRQVEADALIDRLELAADAARIAAESARHACLEARRSLAACEEARTQVAASHEARPSPLAAADVPLASLERAPRALANGGEPAVVALLRGDREMLRAVVARLAEEIGEDAGRLQLLMLDLRDAITVSGRNACMYTFPPRHPFWSQFTLGEARAVAAALASLNRRFDGLDGWSGGLAATPRELAMAISVAGRDPRSVRPQLTPPEIERLWEGTKVAAAEFLLAKAPDLRLEPLTELLGARADAMSELWDNWGRLRLMLLGADPAAA